MEKEAEKTNEERANEIVEQAKVLPDVCIEEILKDRFPNLFYVKKIWDMNRQVSPHAVLEFIAKTGEVLKDTGYGKVWVEITNFQQRFVKSEKQTLLQSFDIEYK